MGPHAGRWGSAVPFFWSAALTCRAVALLLRLLAVPRLVLSPLHLLERGGRVSGRGEVSSSWMSLRASLQPRRQNGVSRRLMLQCRRQNGVSPRLTLRSWRHNGVSRRLMLRCRRHNGVSPRLMLQCRRHNGVSRRLMLQCWRHNGVSPRVTLRCRRHNGLSPRLTLRCWRHNGVSRRHIRAGQGRKQKGHSPCNREWPGTCGFGSGGGGFSGAATRTLEEGAHVGKQHVHSRHAAARKLHGAVDFQRSRHDVAGERHHGVV